MASMQALMDRAGKTRDSAERKRLLKQHSDAMRAVIRALNEMDCPMMAGMGMGMKGDMMGKGESGRPAATPGGMAASGMQGDMMRCHDMMKSRMDVMIQMMDQMLQHQDAAAAGK
jgi:hypothetical protein